MNPKRDQIIGEEGSTLRLTTTERRLKPRTSPESQPRIGFTGASKKFCPSSFFPRWGNASRFESSRPAILNDKSLRNRVYVRFRRLFCFSHRTCDPSSKWAVRGTAKLRQTAGKPGHAHARRVARSAEHLGGRRRSAVGGRRPAGGGRRAASRLFADSVSRDCCRAQGRLLSFSVSEYGTLHKNRPPWRNTALGSDGQGPQKNGRPTVT